jgi:uncharacterized protein (UPF0332 family)
MKEAAAAYLAKARQALDKPRRVFAIGLYDEAGRHAYYATFHAAQALLFERTDKVCATHQGVKAEFAPLAKSDTRIERKHTAFLARAYSLKSAADYETGAAANVTATQASEAIGLAEDFVTVIERFAAE